MEASSSFFAWRRAAAGAPAARAAILLAAAAAAGLPLLSAANLQQVPLGVPAALALLLLLSAWRPAAGLVAVTALAPVSLWPGRAADLPAWRLAEALVLAVLAGALARLALDAGRRAGGPPALPPGLGPAAGLFAGTVAASVAVELSVARAGVLETWPLGTAWLAALSRGYLFGGPILPGLIDAARLVEGVALLLVVLACSRRAAGLPRQLAVASLIGAAGAAAINLQVMLADLLAADSAATLAGYLRGGHRLAGHAGDVNASGSYFLLAALTGLGLAAGRRGTRLLGLSALAAGAACWLSGSRSALVAAVIVGLAAGAWWIRTRRRRGGLRLAAAGALLAAVLALPLAIVGAYPDRGGAAAAESSLRFRIEFATRSLRMWAMQPLFGVGAGRYYALSGEFAADDVEPRWRHENAHNNFLQIAAELGAVGLLAFLGLLAAGGRRVWQALRARAGPDPLLAGAGAGVLAFLLTCLAGHPLLSSEIAYPFWIVLGLALARAHQALPPPPAVSRPATVGGWAAALLLLATLPFRADAAVRGLTAGQPRSALDDLRGGTFGWETERPGGPRFRWSGPHATFLVPGDARAVRIPLRALHARPDRPVTVDIALGDRPVRRIPLRDARWTDVPLPLPPGPPGGVHRLDLSVDPPWTPRERGDGDGRTLGVKVAALAVARDCG